MIDAFDEANRPIVSIAVNVHLHLIERF
jgi:hypothetical protein